MFSSIYHILELYGHLPLLIGIVVFLFYLLSRSWVLLRSKSYEISQRKKTVLEVIILTFSITLTSFFFLPLLFTMNAGVQEMMDLYGGWNKQGHMIDFILHKWLNIWGVGSNHLIRIQDSRYFVCLAVILLPFLLIRITKSRPIILCSWVGLLCIIGGFSSLILTGIDVGKDPASEMVADILPYSQPGIGTRSWALLLVGTLPLVLIPFLGVFVCGEKFDTRKYSVACLIAAVLFPAVLFPFTGVSHFWENGLVPLIAYLLLIGVHCAILVSFPQQRSAMMNVVQIDPSNQFSLILSHVFVLVLAGLFTSCVLLDYYTQRTLDMMFSERAPVYYTPAHVNASDILGGRWTRKGRGYDDFKAIEDDSFWLSIDRRSARGTTLLTFPVSPEVSLQFWKEANVESFLKALEENESLLNQWTEMKNADYWYVTPEGDSNIPNYLLVREVSRLMAKRSVYRMDQGDWEGALDDIETVIYAGSLMVHGILVTHMIGTSVRGVGYTMAANYLVRFKDHEEALKGLSTVLENLKGQARHPMDFNDIALHEPGLLPVVPFADIMTPSYTRAIIIYTKNIMLFDQLRIAMALELYRLQSGSYPETLDELVPEYFYELPTDPFLGEDYLYERGHNEFNLHMRNQDWKTGLTQTGEFLPYSELPQELIDEREKTEDDQ